MACLSEEICGGIQATPGQHHICGQHKPSQGYEDSQLLDGGKNVFIPSDVIDLIQLFDDKKLVTDKWRNVDSRCRLCRSLSGFRGCSEC